MRTLCEVYWPSFDVGWPAKGTIDRGTIGSIHRVVTRDGGQPSHPDQFPYIDLWLNIVNIQPTWLQLCLVAYFKTFMPKWGRWRGILIHRKAQRQWRDNKKRNQFYKNLQRRQKPLHYYTPIHTPLPRPACGEIGGKTGSGATEPQTSPKRKSQSWCHRRKMKKAQMIRWADSDQNEQVLYRSPLTN